MTEEIKNKPASQSHATDSSRVGVYQVISIVCFALAGIIAILTTLFTYNYTFNTINRIQKIGILRQDLQIKPIDFKMYESVLSKRNKKISSSDINITRDPFAESATGTTKR